MAGVVFIEGFTWAGTDVIAGLPAANQLRYWLTRYNRPQSSGGMTLPADGRFSGSNALEFAGGTFIQWLGIPPIVGASGVISSGAVTFGFAIKNELWLDRDFVIMGIGLDDTHVQMWLAVVGGKFALLPGTSGIFPVFSPVATGVTLLQNNTYFYVEWATAIDLAAGTSVLKIEGNTDFSFAGRTQYAATKNVSSFAWGATSRPTTVSDFYMRDDGLFSGPCRIITELPNADGALSQWTPSTGSSHYVLVNEDPPDGDTTYVETSTIGLIDLYAFPSLSYTPASIYAVQVAAYSRKTDVNNHEIAIEVRSGGTNFVGTTQPMLTTDFLDLYLQLYTTDPATGVAWIPGAVNAMQCGMNLIS